MRTAFVASVLLNVLLNEGTKTWMWNEIDRIRIGSLHIAGLEAGHTDGPHTA